LWRSEHEHPITNQLAGQGDELQRRMVRAQSQCVLQSLHDPGTAQEPAGKRGKSRLGLRKPVGPAQYPGSAFQLHLRQRRLGNLRPDEAHPTGELRRLPRQVLAQTAILRHDQVLRERPQGHIDQWGDLQAHGQHIGHQAADAAERSLRIVPGPGQHLFDPLAESFLALLQLLEHGRALFQGAEPLSQGGQFGLLAFQFVASGVGLLAGDLQPALVVLLPVEQLQLGQSLLRAPGGGFGCGKPGLGGAEPVAQFGRRTHPFQMGLSQLFGFAAQAVQRSGQFGKRAFAFGQLHGHALVLGLGTLEFIDRLLHLLFQVALAGAEFHEPPAVTLYLLFQIAAAPAFVFDGRFGRGDAFAIGGIAGFRSPDGLVHVADPGIGFQQACLGRFQLRRHTVSLVAQRLKPGLELGQSLAQTPPVHQRHLRAQLLKPVGVFLVAPRLAGLHAHAAQSAIDLFDDVGEPQQVLLHAIQTPQGLELLGLEAADAGRLFENHPSIARRCLQQRIDLALLDHAVGLCSQAGAGNQIANVAQAGRSAIDQILALAPAIDPPGDMHLGSVDRQQALGVVQRERDLGHVHRPTRARAVENHVGHLLAAQALDTLLAQHPLDSIDDVRLARPIRAYYRGNTRRELEPGTVRKALESDQFQGFEHLGKVEG